MEILKNVGHRIRVFRTEKGYTQEKMADQLNKSVSWYAKVERGEIDINLSNIEVIAKIFEISAGDLIKSAEVNICNNTITTLNGALNNQGNITIKETKKAEVGKVLESILERLNSLETKS
jgi:transcriptional regulator with XRE-family HTH domain